MSKILLIIPFIVNMTVRTPLNRFSFLEKPYGVSVVIPLEEVQEEVVEEETKEININFEDLREKSNVNPEMLNAFLEDTGLAGLGQAYISAEEEYSVNAVILMCITIEESGWGYSDVSLNYNNISGTMIEGEYKYFNSFMDCIDYTARNLGINYLQETGIYHNGYSIEDVNTKYCFKSDEITGELVTDYAWSQKIKEISNEFLSFIKEYN